MTDDAKLLIGLVVITVAVSMGAGYGVGRSTGQDTACQSVGLEWVKDRCMKVTREEAK